MNDDVDDIELKFRKFDSTWKLEIWNLNTKLLFQYEQQELTCYAKG